MARQGILPEHTDLFGKAGRKFLASLELPEGSRRRLDSLMSLIGDFDRETIATTREIDARAKADERVKTLCQIRGVGRYTAMLIIAEVGDVTRFPTARHLCAWAGLAPTVRSSDGKARLGHISRQGSPALRWALTEPAQNNPTGGGPLRATFERIAAGGGFLSSGPSAVSASPTPGHSLIARPLVRFARTDQPPTSAQPQSKL